MPHAVIVDAVRTPTGKRGGKLKDVHPVDLAAHVLNALQERNGLDPAQVDDVIMGCVSQLGEQGINVGRNAVLAAGWPESVPSTTVDRQCGSSQQAAHFAAQGIMAGVYDIAIAAGVESMTRIPMGSNGSMGPGFPFGPAMMERYDNQIFNQGISAEMIAEEWSIPRQELDQLAYESHMRAQQATEEGRFEPEIAPIKVETEDGDIEMMAVDEGIRPGTTLEKLAGLQPAFQEGGVVTAGNSSQISDGAAAVLIMSEERAAELGLTPKARFVQFALVGVDPVTMLTGPIPATAKVLERSELSMDDIDRFEVNEAFASVVAAWRREHDADMAKVNVNGGAMALGHPLGASGAKLLTTLVHELERSGGRYGLQTMCEGGGMANALIIERIERS
ncbi:MAG: thiolase family protein [Acidimicrobiia bacterium]|nr:thiolase family protein [Acidimicrobiia bacterium]NNL70320.1 thiolase family protein [Acidimicrobiia bacterium]